MERKRKNRTGIIICLGFRDMYERLTGKKHGYRDTGLIRRDNS